MVSLYFRWYQRLRLDLVLALSNVIASDHRASMLESMSVTSGISGAVFYNA